MMTLQEKAQQPSIARGGVPLQGVQVGIVLHQNYHPHPLGFLSNAQTWDFPVRYAVIPRDAIDDTQKTYSPYDAFVAQARKLLADGCTAIVAGDGTLAPYQAQLMDDLQVPVMSSPLYQYAMVRAVIPSEQSIGIITLDKSSLNPLSLRCAGIASNTPIVGLGQGGEFYRVLRQQQTTLNMDKAMADVFHAVDTLLASYSTVGAILMACGHLSPFSHGVYHRTGVPVYDAYTLINWLGNSIHPTYFGIPYHNNPHNNGGTMS